MIIYLLFCLVCLWVFIFHWWYVGNNLTGSELLGMVIMSVFPIANVLCLCSILIYLIVDTITITDHNGVILKGRRK